MLKKLDENSLEAFYYEGLKKDFEYECPPYYNLVQMTKEKVYTDLVYLEGEEEKGYAICAEYDDYIFLLFYAIHPEFRGQGYGSRFLNELEEYYRGKKGILIEVESSDNIEDPVRLKTIKKRVAFYHKNGFHRIDGIKEQLFSFKYEIMLRPIHTSHLLDKESAAHVINEIYKVALGKKIGNLRIDISN